MTAFLPSNLISGNGKYPKSSTLPLTASQPQDICVHYSLFPTSTPLRKALFLDFSLVSGVLCSSSKQTSFTSIPTDSYWNPTKGSVTRKRHEIYAGMKKIYVTRVFHFGVKLMPAWYTLCSKFYVYDFVKNNFELCCFLLTQNSWK